MQKKNNENVKTSMPYRRPGDFAIKAPNKKTAEPRVSKISTSGDLRAPKGR